MIKVEYSKEKGLVQTTSSSVDKFEINGAPLFPAETDAIKGNATVELTVTTGHLDAVNAVDQAVLDGKFFVFRDVEGKEYVVFFDPADDAGTEFAAVVAAGAPNVAEAQQVEVNAALVALNTKNKVATAIAAAINALDDFTASAADNVVTITNLRAGKANRSLIDVSGVSGMAGQDAQGEAAEYSWSATQTDVEGASFEIPTAGLTKFESTVAGSFVVLPNLTSADAGALKYVLRTSGDTLVKNAAEDTTLSDLDTGPEHAVLLWTGVAWVTLFGS
tara:strand:- start:59 stop:886 length:828 start_codon:yes stop_codon:yes gene_type:complete